MDSIACVVDNVDAKSKVVEHILLSIQTSEFLSASNRCMVVDIIQKVQGFVGLLVQSGIAWKRFEVLDCINVFCSELVDAEKCLQLCVLVRSINLFQEQEIVCGILRLIQGIQSFLQQVASILRFSLHVEFLKRGAPDLCRNNSFAIADVTACSAKREDELPASATNVIKIQAGDKFLECRRDVSESALPIKPRSHKRQTERVVQYIADCFKVSTAHRASWEGLGLQPSTVSCNIEELGRDTPEQVCGACMNSAQNVLYLLQASSNSLDKRLCLAATCLDKYFAAYDPVPPFVNITQLRGVVHSFVSLNIEREVSIPRRPNRILDTSYSSLLGYSLPGSRSCEDDSELPQGTCGSFYDLEGHTVSSPKSVLKFNLSLDVECAHYPELGFAPYRKAKPGTAGKIADVDSDTLAGVGVECFRRSAREYSNKLLSPIGLYVSGFCGASGIGKTCTAILVVLDKAVKEHFLGGIHWLFLGLNPNVFTLQRCLWKEVAGFVAPFHSIEEGAMHFRTFLSSGPPVLLVLDDVWEAMHLMAFGYCTEGEYSGKILFTSRIPNLLTGKNVEIFRLGSLDDKEGASLFCSAASVRTPDKEVAGLAIEIAGACNGNSMLLQALGSVMYDKIELDSWGKMLCWVQKGARSCVLSTSTADMFAQHRKLQVPIGEHKSPSQGDNNLPNKRRHVPKKDCFAHQQVVAPLEECSLASLLLPCFLCLRDIQPVLQGYFLDMAAFPQGEFVSTQQLHDLWGVDNWSMNRDKVMLILGLFASRSMVEWSLGSGKLVSEGGWSLNWKLTDSFYKLAAFITSSEFVAVEAHVERLWNGEGNNLKDESVSQGSANALATWESRFNKMDTTWTQKRNREAMLGTPAERYEKQSCVSEGGTCGSMSVISWAKKLIGLPSRVSKVGKHMSVMGEGKYRLFLPGKNLDAVPGNLIHEPGVQNATKMSLPRNQFTELSFLFELPALRAAVFCNNEKLTQLSPGVLKGKEHLLLLDLHGCPSLKIFPKTVSALISLQILDLSKCTSLKSLPSSFKDLQELKQLRLTGCSSLTALPSSITMLPKLELLDARDCYKLRTLPSSLGRLSSLLVLDLSCCSSLKTLPSSIGSLVNLQSINLKCCSNLEHSPAPLEQLRMLTRMEECRPMAVPNNLWQMLDLQVLHLSSLKNLTFVSKRIGNLQQLKYLSVSGCRSLESLPEELGALQQLENLDLSFTAIRQLPHSLGELRKLAHLCLRGCARLLSVPRNISSLQSLQVLDMSQCWDFFVIPSSFGEPGSLPLLQELDLSGTKITTLPNLCTGALSKLQTLKLRGCVNLINLPPSFEVCQSLTLLDLEGCVKLISLEGIKMGKIENLWWLNLRNCTALTSLPGEELPSLKFLDVSGCSGLGIVSQSLLHHAQEGRLKLIRWGAVWR